MFNPLSVSMFKVRSQTLPRRKLATLRNGVQDMDDRITREVYELVKWVHLTPMAVVSDYIARRSREMG
jgi:hypothetical protein